MHSDWFNGIEILQGRWQNGEKAGYCYPSKLEKTLCKWDIYVPLVTKGLKRLINKLCLRAAKITHYLNTKSVYIKIIPPYLDGAIQRLPPLTPAHLPLLPLQGQSLYLPTSTKRSESPIVSSPLHSSD